METLTSLGVAPWSYGNLGLSTKFPWTLSSGGEPPYGPAVTQALVIYLPRTLVKDSNSNLLRVSCISVRMVVLPFYPRQLCKLASIFSRSIAKLSASLAEAGGLLYLVPASTLRSCSKSCFIFLTRSGL